jgi:predicted RNase H-like nuclease (RuvC/YqgF family)
LESSNKEYKDLIELLRRENDELKNLVKDLNDKQANNEVLRLENELNQMKIEYKNRMMEDKLKIEIGEKLLRENIEKNEKRVAKLESELTELYQIIAIYESKK